MKTFKPALIALLAAFAVAFSAPRASATPIGNLETANCLGGGVTVTTTMIDWDGNGSGTGCIGTGLGTNVTYTGGGPLVPGVTGTIKDLVAGSLPVSDFMTFSGNSNLHFDLSTVGPGAGNTNCAGLAIGQSCSITNASPFILTLLAGGQTAVALTVFGVARDAGTPGNWEGQFTTNISTMTPAQIQALFLSNPNASITSTHSGSFNVTAVPEPASLTLLGTGLLGAAMRFRRKSSKA